MRSRAFLLCTVTILPTVFAAQAAQAQSLTLETPPVQMPLDEDGVDLASGQVTYPSAAITIGGQNGLTHRRYRVADGWRHNYILSVTKGMEPVGGSQAEVHRVQIGGRSHRFQRSGPGFLSLSGTKGFLYEDAAGFTYYDTAGTQYRFSKTLVSNGESYYEAVEAVGETIRRPDGHTTTLTYRRDGYVNGIWIGVIRLSSVNTNTGYQLSYRYADSTPSYTNADEWYRIIKVTALNNAIERCDPNAPECNPVQRPWPYLGYAESQSGNEKLEIITDALTRQTVLRSDAAKRLVGVRRPGESAESTQIAYDANSRVDRITRNGTYVREYTVEPQGTDLRVISSDDLGRTRVAISDPISGNVKETNSAAAGGMRYEYDPRGFLTKATTTEGDRTEFVVDSYGRVRTVSRYGKAGEGPMRTTTVYGDESCVDPVMCFKPESVTDERGQMTLYEWDPNHGGLTYISRPADVTGNRPRTYISYASLNARYLNASGAMVTAPTALVLPVESRRCRTASDCAGSASEQVVAYGYDSQISPNLETTSVTQRAGDGTLAATTSATYDHLGNAVTIDGPLAGAADVRTLVYDTVGQQIGAIEPDPDGAGGNPHIATRRTLNPLGQVIKLEIGTVSISSYAAWQSLAPHAEFRAAYDGAGRMSSEAQVLPGTSTQVSLTQYSYDIAGRLQCAAKRLNAPSTATVLPGSACTQMSPGAFGADRISKNVYDGSDRITGVYSGVGTALEQLTVEVGYNYNSQLVWVEDAKNNRTEYRRDGYGRVTEIWYPSKTSPGYADSTDKEFFEYNAAGDVILHRGRHGLGTTYAYDNLGRITVKTPSQIGSTYYRYDLFGNLTEARSGWSTGPGYSFGYDGLGRQTSVANTMSGAAQQLTYEYDVAGRRSALVHPDGQRFTYAYDALGRNTGISGDVAGSLMQNSFTAKGELSQRTHGANAFRSVFEHDQAGRLSGLDTTRFGHSYDSAKTFGYNPVGQVVSETNSNPLYAWQAGPDNTIPYATNGLNQYTSVAGRSYQHDTAGNLTYDGATSYIYDQENRLKSVSGQNTATLAYDPLGRLWEVQDGSGNRRRMLYDGDALIAEYDGANQMIARYVHGVSAEDDPFVSFAGSSTALGNARFLNRDRLGSTILQADASGGSLQAYVYDEFGVPGPGPKARFGFTGQAWVPEAGLYYYKARMYSPTLGRFMQTDPIGYADGMNMYAYVGNDPINAVDPTGTEITVTGTRIPKLRFDDFFWPRVEINFDAGFGGDASPGGGGSPGLDDTTEEKPPCPAPPQDRPIGNVFTATLGLLRTPQFGLVADIFERQANNFSETLFPDLASNGTARDASRHFFLSFTLARQYGGGRATSILNAIEVIGSNSIAEQRQDTFNNFVGVAMAQDPALANLTAAEAYKVAIARGCLQQTAN